MYTVDVENGKVVVSADAPRTSLVSRVSKVDTKTKLFERGRGPEAAIPFLEYSISNTTQRCE
jgi:hypothetical protein